MTPEKKAKQKAKRELKRLYNLGKKIIRAAARKQADIELGKTVIVTEEDGVKKYAFPPEQKFHVPNFNRLVWLNGKTYRHGVDRKNSPGLKDEHAAAILEESSRSFAREVDQALAPPPQEPSLPMVSPAQVI